MSDDKSKTIEDLTEYINKRAISYEEPTIILSEKQYEYFKKHLNEECEEAQRENKALKKEIEELKTQLKHYELELQSDFDSEEWNKQSKNIE